MAMSHPPPCPAAGQSSGATHQEGESLGWVDALAVELASAEAFTSRYCGKAGCPSVYPHSEKPYMLSRLMPDATA